MRIFVRLLLLMVSLPVFAQARLIPMPREYREPRDISLKDGLRVECLRCDADDKFAVEDLKQDFAERGVKSGAAGIALAVLHENSIRGKALLKHARITFTNVMHDEGYAIVPKGRTIAVVAATSAGIFYGLQTVKQMVDTTGASPALHAALVSDYPAMRWRGVHDDLSRGPVPTLEFQKKQIRTFAAYKINLYSPYFENTMQYASDPLAAPPGNSISPEDAKELSAYAAKYHITIAPEQEAFGHLHYMLNVEQYAHLAELPHGHVLAPGQPESIQFIERMFKELAADYPGPFLHIGADETFELGRGQTKEQVDKLGNGKVYLDYLQRVVEQLKPLHRKVLFWGDIAMNDPELVKALPEELKKSVIAIPWQYNPHPEGFAKYLDPFTKAGLECWVSPGVNNWDRVYPNYNNALPNIQRFTAEGQKAGCTGQLNTIWDDDGEALFNSNWYGVLFGAATAWQQGDSSIDKFQDDYGYIFHGDTTGRINQAQRELMAAHKLLTENYKSSDGTNVLFWIDPWSPNGAVISGKIKPYTRDLRLHAEKALTLILQARRGATLREQDTLDAMELGARRFDFIGLKFELADEIATAYRQAYALKDSQDRIDRRQVSRLLSDINQLNFVYGKLEDLRNGYTMNEELFTRAWMKSYRPLWIGNITIRYTMAKELWVTRMEKTRAAQLQWTSTHTLPSPESMGIPVEK